MLSSSRPTHTHTYPCHTPRALALGNIWPRFLFTLFIACAAIERDIIMIILPRAPVFLHCSSSERSIHLHPWPRRTCAPPTPPPPRAARSQPRHPPGTRVVLVRPAPMLPAGRCAACTRAAHYVCGGAGVYCPP